MGDVALWDKGSADLVGPAACCCTFTQQLRRLATACDSCTPVAMPRPHPSRGRGSSRHAGGVAGGTGAVCRVYAAGQIRNASPDPLIAIHPSRCSIHPSIQMPHLQQQAPCGMHEGEACSPPRPHAPISQACPAPARERLPVRRRCTVGRRARTGAHTSQTHPHTEADAPASRYVGLVPRHSHALAAR